MATILSAIPAFANIVANGGFETGDLTSWTTSSGAGLLPWFTDTSAPGPHSGTYSGQTGCETSSCLDYATGSFLLQNLATTPGTAYTLDFFVTFRRPVAECAGACELDVYWDGSLVGQFPNTVNGLDQYVEHTILLPAAVSSSTELRFLGIDLPSYLGLDDVSVDAASTPEPASMLSMMAGLGTIAGLLRRKFARR